MTWRLFQVVTLHSTFNSLRPNDAIWRQRSGSTLALCNGLLPEVITWINVDLSSPRSSDNQLRAISQELPQPSVTKIYLKITHKNHSNFPGVNELISDWYNWKHWAMRRNGNLGMRLFSNIDWLIVSGYTLIKKSTGWKRNTEWDTRTNINHCEIHVKLRMFL